jgi:hypothetical protein
MLMPFDESKSEIRYRSMDIQFYENHHDMEYWKVSDNTNFCCSTRGLNTLHSGWSLGCVEQYERPSIMESFLKVIEIL